MHQLSSALLIVLLLGSAQAMHTMPTTASPDSLLTDPTTTTTTTTDQDMVMMSDEDQVVSGSGSGPRSAQLNVPGFGTLDLSLFSRVFPGLPAPSLPNLTMPSLPKLFSATPCASMRSARVGSCRQEEECIAGHGLPDGPCGLGLGVCCTAPFTCGQMIIGNETLITSPGFPEPSTKSDVCRITIVKGLEVVQIRLDLLVFDIAGADSAGACSEDVMEITGANSDAVVPKICGMNQGQHLYIPVDKTAPLSTLMIKFLLSKSSSAHRLFKIMVTQLKKDHPDLAPAGCVQYYNGKEGVVRSFNYEHVKDVGIRSIKGLKYGVCFKKTMASDKCKVKLNPTYTRVTRSVGAGHQVGVAAAGPVRYGYFPAQHPITNYQQRSYNNNNGLPVYRRPVYLNRPILRYYKPQAASYPVYQQQPHARPAVMYYPMPSPVSSKSYYYYPAAEKKVDLVDKKKEELDGLLAKKQLLIEELSSLLKVPELAKLPSLPTLAPLPTLPPFSLPTLPSLPAVSLPSLPALPSLPSLPGLTIAKLPSLEDLLAKKIEKVDELKKEIKQEVPYKQTGYGHPAHLYKQEVDLKEKSLLEKKVDLINSLVAGHKSLPAPAVHYDAYGKPIDLKQTLVEKKTDLLQQKVDLINGLIAHHKSPVQPAVHYDAYGKPIDLKDSLLEKKTDLLQQKVNLINGLVSGHKSPAPHATYDSYGKKTEVKEIVKEVIDIKKDAVNELISNINNFNKNLLLSPLPTFPSMISKDAYGLIVDNDHEQLGRGFSIAYKEECEV